MKNLLGKNEFAKLKKLDSYNKLYEDMDFSNKTNWSDSLVGRGLNKLFSFGARKMQEIVLNNLKNQLENEYLKGILKAMAKNGTKSEDIETVDLMIDVYLIKEKDKATDVLLVNKILPKSYSKKIFTVVKPDKNDYMYKIAAHDINAKVTVTDEDKSKITKIENVVDLKKVVVESDDKSETYYIATTQLPVQGEGTQTQTTQPTESQTTTATGTTQHLLGYTPTSPTIGSVAEYTNNNGEKKEVKLISMSEKEVDGEKQKLEPDQYFVQILQDGKPTDVKITVNKNRLSPLKTKEPLSLPAPTESKWNKIRKETDDIYNKLIKTLPEDKKRKLEKAQKYAMRFTGGGDEGEKESFWKQYKNIIKELDSTVEFVNESGYFKFRFDKAYQELDNFIKLYEDGQTQTQGQSQSTTIGYEVIKYSEEQALEKKKKNSLKSLLSTSKINSEDKDIIKTYGNINISGFDSAGIAKKFEEDKNLRISARTLVDKEAIKEIQLRAEWMYQEDKYKNKEKESYSRVNFTTSGPDQAKLKNTWMKKIARVKSIFTIFFADENGNFPQSLDPVALINSDDSFRKSFNQYKTDESIPDNKARTEDPIANIEIPDILKTSCNLHDGSPKDDGKGIFLVETSSGREIGILYQYLSVKDGVCYKFLGIVDLVSIIKTITKESTPDEVKKLIKKYHYTSTGSDNSGGYGTTKLTEADEKFQTIYHAFRGDVKWDTTGKNVTTKNSTSGFYYTGRVETGSKVMPQILLVKENDDWTKYTQFVSKIVDRKIEKYVSFAEFDKSPDKTDKNKLQNYKFHFKINKNYSIDSDGYDLWSIGNFNNDEDKKRNSALKQTISKAKQLNLLGLKV